MQLRHQAVSHGQHLQISKEIFKLARNAFAVHCVDVQLINRLMIILINVRAGHSCYVLIITESIEILTTTRVVAAIRSMIMNRLEFAVELIRIRDL